MRETETKTETVLMATGRMTNVMHHAHGPPYIILYGLSHTPSLVRRNAARKYLLQLHWDRRRALQAERSLRIAFRSLHEPCLASGWWAVGSGHCTTVSPVHLRICAFMHAEVAGR